MKANFRDMFENYLPGELIDIFSNCEIQCLSHDEAAGQVKVETVFDALPRLNDILEAEQGAFKAGAFCAAFCP